MRRHLYTLLLCPVMTSTLWAQGRLVQGVVTSSEDGEPIIGASVIFKEKPGVGASTDLDGRFSITIPEGAKTLRISYIGMRTIEIPITQGVMRIKLDTDSKALSEVVVTGMTKVDKRLFTGASTKVSGDKTKLDGIADAARALEGKAAGVSVQNVSATFGAAPKVRVRGATSIFGASKPLWVVDGVVMDDVVDIDASSLSSGDATTLISSAIAGLNPDDIESFQVLKDGSATSIYGARAMAGVIVVTTKKGRSGQSRISYTGEYTYRIKPNYSQYNIMNSQEQISVYRELERKGWLQLADVSNAASSGLYGKMYELINNGELINTEASRLSYLSAGEFRNTDWFATLFQDNVMNSHSISLSTGTDKATVYASLSALVDPGWTLQSKVNRYTANLNTTYNISPKLQLGVLANVALRQQNAPGTVARGTNPITGEVSREFDINPYSYALNTSRTLDPGVYYTRNYAPFNIINELGANYIDLDVLDTKFQAELKYKPLRGLEIAMLGDVKYSSSDTQHTITEKSNQAQAYRAMGTTYIRDNNPYLYRNPNDPYAVPVSVLPQGGFSNRNTYKLFGWDWRASATYNTELGRSILNLYGGVEVNALDRSSRSDAGVGIIDQLGSLQFFDPLYFQRLKEQGLVLTQITNDHYRNVALFANATYSYRGRYTVNGTLRYEGTNKMGRSIQARWLPTWNLSTAWNVHEEKFFSSLRPTLSSLTLKASYSLTADKGPTSVTNSTTIIRSSTPWRYPVNTQQTALEVEQPENNELTYEKKHEFNFGVDLGFLEGRLLTSLDWYYRDNFDLIGPVTTMGISGLITKYGNVASMNSSGVELSISSVNIKGKDFTWSTDFVYSYARNRVTALSSGNQTVAALVTGTGFAREGYPVGSVFSIPFTGLNSEGLPTFINQLGEKTVTGINFQERERTDYLQYEGTADPKHFGSLGNTFSYKGWSLNVFMTYGFGNVVRLDPVFRSSYDDLVATPKEFTNRWINVGDEAITNVPTIASRRMAHNDTNLTYAYNAYNYSTARIAKGDFVRLKELSLAYAFPKTWAKKLSLSDLSLKLQATNLLLLYADKKLQGQDPEFLNAGGVASPLARQITLTLRVGI